MNKDVKDQPFSLFKKESKKAARELCYDDVVIEKIHNAKTETEIVRILGDARRARCEY